MQFPTWSLVSMVAILANAACSTFDAANRTWDRPVERAQAPGEDAQSEEDTAEVGEHEYPHHHAAVFLGDTVEGGDHAFTVGFDYEYRVEEHFGFGGLVDFAIRGSERDSVFAAAIYVHPVEELSILAAPGIEHTDGENLFVFRTGLSYHIPVGGPYSIAPSAFVDFLEGGEHPVVFGIAFGVDF